MRNVVTDFSTALGVIVTLTLIAIAMSLGGNILSFVDLRSILIVVAGTFFLTVACTTFSEVMRVPALIMKSIKYESDLPKKSAMTSLKIADTARKKGILALQQFDGYKATPYFLKKGVQLIIDGMAPEEAVVIMQNEMDSKMERHRKSVIILKKAAEIAPAMGLIGTLIGLVRMLGNLSDPSTIGPSMAVALLTTLYGALLAFTVFIPLASKLERNSREEELILQVYILAMTSIGKKENPRRLEIALNAMLPATQRIKFFA